MGVARRKAVTATPHGEALAVLVVDPESYTYWLVGGTSEGVCAVLSALDRPEWASRVAYRVSLADPKVVAVELRERHGGDVPTLWSGIPGLAVWREGVGNYLTAVLHIRAEFGSQSKAGGGG